MDSETKQATSFTSLLQSLSKLIAWVGASSGAIGLVLTIFGYLVEHAYLDRLGVPRSYYEAKPVEYTTAGAKFLMGMLALAFPGLIQFTVRYWWLAVLLVAMVLMARKWRWPQEWRWLAAGAFLFVWMCVSLPRFDDSIGSHDAYALVAAFTAVAVAGLIYAFAELTYFPPGGDRAAGWRFYAPRLPFLFLLAVAVLCLPYLRGTYATQRNSPTVEFLGKDRAYLCELSGQPADTCATQSWQLIEMGKDHAILRLTSDNKIYIVPAAELTTFRVVAKEPLP